jgi:hypothetical protein
MILKKNIFPDIIANLETEFGINYFTFTSTNSFDYTSPSNLKILRKKPNVCLIQ